MEATNQGAPLDDAQTRWKPATVAETGTESESEAGSESATESAAESESASESATESASTSEPAPVIDPASRLGVFASDPSLGSAAESVGAPPAPRAREPKLEAPPREGPRVRRSLTGALLETDGSWADLAQRAGIGVVLAAGYGVALGARDGGIAMLTHAVGVPAALVAVAMLGLPALYVVLALFDAPLSVRKAGGAAVAGVASAGLVLAGVAPLAALYVVTSGSADAASVAGGIGLALGGLLGLRHLAGALRAALETADSATRFVAALSQTGFAVFAMLLAWRVWSSLLPLVGGAS